MRLMLIGTDRNLFMPHSAIAQRFARMGHLFSQDFYQSIVFSTRAHGAKGAYAVAPNVQACPTNSISRLLYGLDAWRIAKKLPRPDLVTAQDPFETGLAALFIARHFGAPLMVEVHTDFLSPAFARHSVLNRIRVHIAGFVLRRAQGGYAVSRRTRDAMVVRYALKVPFEVLPIAVDLAKFAALPRAPHKNNLLWVGRFEAEKNPALALRALAQARAQGHEVRLTMLGAGALEPRLRVLAQSLGIEAHVAFAGWGDPAAYLPEAELLLATSRYEGYGMATVEALAACVPVLSTDVGVAREAGAVIAEKSYAEALVTWLEGPRERGVLSLPPYGSEEEHFKRTRDFYAAQI